MTEKLERLPEPSIFSKEDRISEPTTIELEEPVTHGGKTLSEITMRPIRGKDVRGFSEGMEELPRQIEMVAELAALPPSVIDQLTGEDIGKALSVLQGMLWVTFDIPSFTVDEEGDVKEAPLPQLKAPYTIKFREELKFKRKGAGAKDPFEALSEITFQAMRGAIARKLPKGGGVSVRTCPWAIEQLCGIPREAVDALQGPDLNEALGVAICFLGSIQPTTRRFGRS